MKKIKFKHAVDRFGEWHFVDTEGESAQICDMPFVIHKEFSLSAGEFTKLWMVSELTTGARVFGDGKKTRKEAIACATQMIERRMGIVRQSIQLTMESIRKQYQAEEENLRMRYPNFAYKNWD